MAFRQSKLVLLFQFPTILLFLASCGDAARGLRNLTLSIEPAWVRRGQSAQLHCRYEMKGAPLYSVKWYRGNLEFYRFSPFDNPPAKIFPYTGIKVDMSVSNATHVTLRNVGFNLSGNFTCEVTADAPSFYTALATNILTVVELPHSPPTLWTERVKYDPGDMLNANCSSPPSKPPASITFLVNNTPVGHGPTVLHSTHDNLQWATRNLSIQLLPSHYQNGQLVLRCTAEVGALYAESTEAPLGTSRKEPIPERVTSPSSGTSPSPDAATRVIAALLIKVSVIRFLTR
ncbi:uncharacterized protein LOC129799092 [Phlebotomus papatasi]|uniref:uncharacterized protein LOC129799092 n=1 Tax=Phlebotomus papatasi TaxID=29031 RepID=UPI0024836E9C|nr:uncharacterized protein LOC129799092 [Phlebotomus papatasi]XP_055698710.1 uncharacterized protein LOC129799092 [Phlebotomus papatasi]XP_055698718.1 uncharacterized protein LOC129799092 [Phlebotomus papatasi]XP_055698727.1 uncharacterized protein LOC129799092 [Phlebotomus papatasi]